MKAFLLLTILLSGLFSEAYGQWTNIWINNGSYFQGGCFATGADTCFVGNSSGKIFRTTNGGTSWDSVQTIFTQSWFNDIQFPSATIGYACGGSAFGMHHSIIAKTNNGGQTWDSLTANSFNYEFNCMSFPNENTGYIGGYDLIKTTNGGQSFTPLTLPVANSFVTDLHFFTPDKGIISTQTHLFGTFGEFARIALTTDGGTTWTTTFVDSAAGGIWESKNVNAITFRDAQNGFAVGNNGRVLRTTDGGLTWNLSIITTDSMHLSDVVFKENSLLGYITGWKYTATEAVGKIYKTTDGGINWQQDFSLPEGIINISLSGNKAYATGANKVFKTALPSAAPEIKIKTTGISIYPNPATNKGTIAFSPLNEKEYHVQLLDMRGRLVRQKTIVPEGNSEAELSLHGLPAGVYVVKIVSDGYTQAEKLVIE